MILDKETEVVMVGKNCQYYGNLGYPNKYGSKVMVKVEDLSHGAHVKIKVKCDFCGKERYVTYKDYYKTTHGGTRPLSCDKCKTKNITANTCLEKYGYAYTLQVPEIRKKGEETMITKYGVKSPQQSDAIKEKTRQTNIERYGGPSSLCNSEIREKQALSMAKNGTVRTSFQQKYLANLYKGQLNINCNKFLLDIYIPEYKIDIEYNGGGHALPVQTGRLTQQEFEKREIIRGKIIRSNDIKQMIIISLNDDLPSDEILLEMLNNAITYFTNTNHTWIEYHIQNGTYRNAVGTYDYDFGELIPKYKYYNDCQYIG